MKPDRGSWIAAGGAAAVIIGAFLPWARVLFASASGVDGGDGWITAIAGAIAGAVAVSVGTHNLGPRWHAVSFVAAVIVALVAFADVVDIGTTDGATVGAGLWLTMAGATALAIGAGLRVAQIAERPGDASAFTSYR